MPNKAVQDIPLSVIRRLARYYRFLLSLEKGGTSKISSRELARNMRLTASQIRQDLSYFGGFGQQGYGYNVSQLRAELERILYLDKRLPAILIGVGNLGRALMGYLAHEAQSISLIGLFDRDPTSVLEIISDIDIKGIEELEEFCIEHKPEVAILCIPEKDAQAMAERLVSYGIKGFWNFSHVDLRLNQNILVENVHLGDSLTALGFQVHILGEENS